MRDNDTYADGDTPDTVEENTCAGEECDAFVLTHEEFCMGCSDGTNQFYESNSDP